MLSSMSAAALFGSLVLLSAQILPPPSVSETFTRKLGITPIGVVVTDYPGRPLSDAGLVLVSVHADENESVVAARRALEEFGGRLVELQHSGGRYVSFQLEPGGERYAIDPNRVYTDTGRPYGFLTPDEGSVRNAAALEAVRTFQQRFVQEHILAGARMVVAVHNNGSPGEEPPGLSLHDEIIGPEVEACSEPYGDPGRPGDPRFSDFLLINDWCLYEALLGSGLNVGLVDRERLEKGRENPEVNDGSMSVFFTLEQPTLYGNVEALRDRAKPSWDVRPAAAERQEAMLRTLLAVLEQNRGLWIPELEEMP